MTWLTPNVLRIDNFTDWHRFADEYGQVFVTMDHGKWKTFLPDGSVYLAKELDSIRAEASRYHCTLLMEN